MKTSFVLRLCLAVIAAFSFVQCSSTPTTRIQKNQAMYNKLSAKERHLATHGLISEGMSRDAVFLAWGKPDSVAVGVSRGRESENWTYEGQRPVRSMSMNMGFGFGGLGGWGPYGYGGWGPYGFGGGYPMFGGGSAVTYIPYTSGTVDFVGGRVVSWKSIKR